MCDLLLAESIQGLKYRFDNFVMQIHYLRITLISEMCNFLLYTSCQFTLQGSWRWEGNTPGMEHRTSGLRNLMLVVKKFSSVKMSERENWCQVPSVSPYWQKMFSCELLQLTRKESWADYANSFLSALFELCGVKILVIRVWQSHKSDLQDMDTAPGIQPLKVYLSLCSLWP